MEHVYVCMYVCMYVISASLSINTVEHKRSLNRTFANPVCRSVCLFVRKVYCGKVADWIRMPFGVVSGVGLGIRALDGVHVPQGEGEVLGFCDPIGLNGIF